MKLYRFVSLEDFINIAVNKKDRFTKPSQWDDKYEAYLMSLLDKDDGIQRIVEYLYNDVSPQNYYAVSDNFFRMWHSKWYSYVQCWSKNAETDVMWQIYSYGNHAVRLKSTDKKLLENAETIFPKDNYSVALRKVEYDVNAKSDIVKKQTGQMKDSLLVQESFFHKRKAFQHEKEYRLVITDNRLNLAGLESMGVKYKISEKVEGKTDSEIINYLVEKIKNNRAELKKECIVQPLYGDIPQVSDLIESVMVHPKAEDWYVSIIGDICEREGIRFEGRSQLYGIVDDFEK